MKTLNSKFIIALAVVVFCLFNAGQAFATVKIIDLGTLGGTISEAWGINNLGEVTGRAYLHGNNPYHAFLYTGGVMHDLGILCSDFYGKSFGYGINDSGQIAGDTCSNNIPSRAFLYSDGVMGDLGTLGGTQSFAYGINNAGHIVGTAALPGDPAAHAFLHSGGVMTDLGTLGGGFSWAYGINDSDQIVGASNTSNIPSSTCRAFLYSGGTMTQITPDLWSYAYDINNSGQVVGTAFFPSKDRQAFLYSGSVLTDLGTLGGAGASEAWGINNNGQIVGWSSIINGPVHAFLYDEEEMTDLNTLLPPGSGWVLNYALDINDKGGIVGVGTIGGQSHAFLMLPSDADTDSDGISDDQDNCYSVPNGPTLGTCLPGSDKEGVTCTSDADCVVGCSSNGKCSMSQEDTDADGTGDVCDTHERIRPLVREYYLDILGREPDTAGWNYWTNEIKHIMSLGIYVGEGFQAQARFFFNSSEYVNKNKSDSAFVTDLYHTFFQREPDSAGLTYWVGQLSCLTRNMLITQFVYSTEFKNKIASTFGADIVRPENNVVNDYYRGFLNRFPDDGGFNSYLTQIRQFQCQGHNIGDFKNLLYQIALTFVQGAEYTGRNRNNTEYVEDLYNGILRRGADCAGFTTWVNSLNSGTSRANVLKSFTDSTEFGGRVTTIAIAGCIP